MATARKTAHDLEPARLGIELGSLAVEPCLDLRACVSERHVHAGILSKDEFDISLRIRAAHHFRDEVVEALHRRDAGDLSAHVRTVAVGGVDLAGLRPHELGAQLDLSGSHRSERCLCAPVSAERRSDRPVGGRGAEQLALARYAICVHRRRAVEEHRCATGINLAQKRIDRSHTNRKRNEIHQLALVVAWFDRTFKTWGAKVYPRIVGKAFPRRAAVEHARVVSPGVWQLKLALPRKFDPFPVSISGQALQPLPLLPWRFRNDEAHLLHVVAEAMRAHLHRKSVFLPSDERQALGRLELVVAGADPEPVSDDPHAVGIARLLGLERRKLHSHVRIAAGAPSQNAAYVVGLEIRTEKVFAGRRAKRGRKHGTRDRQCSSRSAVHFAFPFVS